MHSFLPFLHSDSMGIIMKQSPLAAQMIQASAPKCMDSPIANQML